MKHGSISDFETSRSDTACDRGQGKASPRLAASLSSTGLVSKVGMDKNASPLSLVARMPSAELAAKVGGPIKVTETRRVVRRAPRL